jgi:hypothetical protein
MRKQLIGYVGTACATGFSRTSLPAELASRPLHIPTRPLILEGIYSKASLVERPSAVGKTRYFSAKAIF